MPQPADCVVVALGVECPIHQGAKTIRAGRAVEPERDRAIILTALLAGLRSEELINGNIGDLRRTADGAVIHVRGKGNKDRSIPIEAPLVDVIEHYLDSRHHRLPTTAKRRALAKWGAISCQGSRVRLYDVAPSIPHGIHIGI